MAQPTRPYEYPDPGVIAQEARALNALPGVASNIATVGNTGSIMGAPTAARAKPRLKLRTNGEIVIMGADSAMALFPPLNPLQPIAQPPQFAAAGRAWDYPVGWNTRVTPRTGQGIGFPMLKGLADGYDVLRGLIERVKDKICGQQWAIRPRDKKQKEDPRCDLLEDFLAYPDKVHTWVDWTRMLLEQAIVYDAPAIWLRPDRGGDMYGLEIIDGAMVSPKIMADGRLPPPDVGPAYQQVIKGMPAVDYVMPVPKGFDVPDDPSGIPYPELLYKPRNPRVDSVYGFGPVEQMITSVNIALKREGYLLDYYTSGSTPDLIMQVPETWQPQQIKEFSLWWQAMLQGNLANRRGAMFVPKGVTPFDTKEKALTDQTDEWLIRIMCFFMGLNPMPFLKQMNKGQEKTHHEEAAAEGLGPWLRWYADLFDHIIRLKWGWADLEFRWEMDEAIDPAEQATIDVQLVNAKIYHPDEIRAMRGDDAMPDDMRLQMDMPNYNGAANSTQLPEEQQAAKDEAAAALAAAKPAPVIGGPGKPVGKPPEKYGRSTRGGLR